MIRNIFVPESIDSYYVFDKRIVACEITKSHVKAAVARMHKNNKTIESVIEKPIEQDASVAYQDRVVETLAGILSRIGRYDDLHVILPAGIIIFKEITVPFVNLNKIKLILPFEIEPLLPFPTSEAIVDCIVTHRDAHSSTVFVAAVKKDQLAEYVEFFKKAGADPTRVTVDLFELYALYKAVYPDDKKNIILMYMDPHTTRLGFVIDGQLKAVRFLSQGIIKLAKTLMREPENLLKTGFEQEDQATIAQAEPFFADMRLTVNAVSQRLQPGTTFEKIFLTGAATDIKHFDSIVEKITGIACGNIRTHALLQYGIATFRENHGLPDGSILPISDALSFPVTFNFNLYATHARAKESHLLAKQLIVALSLTVLTAGLFITKNILTARRFKKEIAESEKETVTLLKKEFPALGRQAASGSLDTIKKAAQVEVNREKEIWFALTQQNRSSFPIYLQEISTRLDPDGLGLNLTRLTLQEDTMQIEGSVKNYEALKRLEEDLRQSKIFVSVPRFEELKFAKTLTLNKTPGERA